MSSQGKLLAQLEPLPSDVRKWRILLLVSAVNSLTQRVQTYLADMGCSRVSTELALSDETMVSAVLAHSPHVIICPFLVKKVPDVIYSNVSHRCLRSFPLTWLPARECSNPLVNALRDEGGLRPLFSCAPRWRPI